MSALMNTYGTRSLTLVKGDGPYVWDDQGRRYFDAISGIAVCGLGYSHPAVSEAICSQASTLIHCSNLYLIEPQQRLGQLLTGIARMDEVFFSNSGAEANEAALKIARKFGQEQGIEKPEVITTQNSFHGRTMATLSATGNEKIKHGFYPLLEGFTHAQYDNIGAIEAAATPNTVAVMVEPVQGEGGINIPSNDYLNMLRKLCDEHNWLLILDEIQSGNGRTGKYFAFQHSKIKPDVLTTAKGLGNGVPIGACMACGKGAQILQPGNHGSTFGGNPLATNAALAVVGAVNTPETLTRVNELGLLLLEGFKEQLADCKHIADIRGKGLMLGIELKHECADILEQARELGWLINITAASKVIRLLPPFIMTNEQAHSLIHDLSKLILAHKPQ